MYEESYDEELHEIEQTVHDGLQAQGYITREQLGDVVTWKLDNQAGRRSGNIERVNRVPDEFVRRVSEAALLVDDPEVQLKTLSSIPGIGYATATVVLTFYDPERYAVGDRYIVDLFFGEDRQMRVTDYPKLLSECVTGIREGSLSERWRKRTISDIEKRMVSRRPAFEGCWAQSIA